MLACCVGGVFRSKAAVKSHDATWAGAGRTTMESLQTWFWIFHLWAFRNLWLLPNFHDLTSSSGTVYRAKTQFRNLECKCSTLENRLDPYYRSEAGILSSYFTSNGMGGTQTLRNVWGHIAPSNRTRLKPRQSHPRASCLTTVLFLEERQQSLRDETY